MLAGYRLLDLSYDRPPGATCTHLLADLGVDVIKVEPPQGGRMYQSAQLEGEARAFDTLNRNKRSIVLDLKAPEGREVFHRLAHEADIIVESSRPGVTRRLGIDYAT